MQVPEDVTAVARAIAERQPVDWALAESSGDAAWRDMVRELKVIATIADLHHEGRAHAAPTTWGPFRMVELVGRGVYGDVYRAIDTKLDREVALKLLRLVAGETAGTEVLDEARLLARVRHPNVVTIHGADGFDGRVGLWMEFVDGRTLEDVLQQDGPLPARDLAAVCLDVCRALEAVHEAGLLHRDIKAQNVMRELGGRHVLMDFGAGRSTERHGPFHLAGTPLYIAPEVLDGEPSSRQSDIYGVGVLLFHLATGRYPVEAATLDDLRRRHAAVDRQDLKALRPDCPPALIAVVDRALAEAPSDRFATAREMAEAAAPLADAPRPGKRTLGRLVGAIALVAVCAAAIWLSGPRDEPSASARTQVLWEDAADLQGTTSADGRFLSFVDRTTERLAVRDLVSGRTTLLPQSDETESLEGWTTLSPDGRWIAYGHWRSSGTGRPRVVVSLIGVDGRNGRMLLDDPGVAYALPNAWSPDGEWVAISVARRDHSAIELAARDGSVTRPIVRLRPEEFPGPVQFSADGRWVVFLFRGAVSLVKTDGSSERPVEVVPAERVLGWTADDRLLFVRDRQGATEVYALSMADGRAVGEPVRLDGAANLGRLLPIAVADGGGVAALGLTRSGTLTYGSVQLATDAVTMAIDPATGATGPERVGRQLFASGVGGLEGGLRYSTDGTHTLYRATRDSVLIEWTNGSTRTLVPRLTDMRRVESAPDGQALIAGGRVGGDWGIYRVDLETGEASVFVTGIPPISRFTIAPDGSTIYYTHDDTSVVARDLRTGAERTVWDRGAWHLAVSRDGRRLALVSGRGVEILDVDTGGVVTRADEPAGARFWGGDWSPDGRQFFATVTHGSTDSRGEVWRIPVDGGEPVRHPLAAPARGGWMRPDGREFAMMRWVYRQQVWKLENFLPAPEPAADGSTPRRPASE
jgi:serine/threonine protein kinase